MKLEETIIWAKEEGGLSVCEISRALRWKAGTVHDFLRDHGVIEKLPRRTTKPPPVVGIDALILKKLFERGLSFERWAKGWGYDLDEAVGLLSSQFDDTNTDSICLHYALNRDLPVEYERVYDKAVTTAFKMPNDIDRHDSFIQEWVPEKNQYVARVVGLEGDTDAPVAMGFTAGKALENLLADFKMYKQVKHLHIASKLREAIAKKELRF